MATLERFRRPSAGKQGAADPWVIARMVRIAATYGPFPARCLPRAVVLWALLRRQGVDAEIKLGVRRGDRGVEAHAWVELDGVALEQDTGEPSFVPLRAAPIS